MYSQVYIQSINFNPSSTGGPRVTEEFIGTGPDAATRARRTLAQRFENPLFSDHVHEHRVYASNTLVDDRGGTVTQRIIIRETTTHDKDSTEVKSFPLRRSSAIFELAGVTTP